MAPAAYHDPALETDLTQVSTPSVYHSDDKDFFRGHLALMITEALMATEAPAHFGHLLYKSGPPGCVAEKKRFPAN